MTTTEPLTASATNETSAGERASTADEIPQFDSLDAMRDEHTRLLRLFYSVGATPEVLAEAKRFLARGRVTGTNFDRADERLEAQRILDQWGTVIMKAVHQEIDATLADFEGKDLSDKPCPYVGLRPFEEEDRNYFCGRIRLRKEAIGILAKQQFLAVLGPSGSGKSSLVLSGILPDLRSGAVPSSSTWIYVPVLVPGATPMDSLLNALRACGNLLPATTDAPLLFAEPATLPQLLSGSTAGRPILLVVDQFEETFTLCEEMPVREAFVRSLLALVEDKQAGHRVILTMRSDFEPRLALFPDLQARFLEDGAVLRAVPLTRNELREAIEDPAKAVGLRFHREVIDALLKDVGDEMTGLPLLQFTLRKLWDTKRGDRITFDQYTRLGGAKGALAKSANEFYENLVPEEKTIAKRILLRMVRLGEGLEVTSARIRRSVLYELGYDRAKIDNVARKLVETGLIRVTRATSADDDQLEVAHEAMIRNWRRFVGWLEKDRVSLLIRRRLDDKTAEWVRLGSGTAGLLDETQLCEAQEWLQTTDAKALGFHASLPTLVEKSQQAIVAANKEKELAEERLREQTRRTEEEKRQREFAEETLANQLRLQEEVRRAEAERQMARAQAKVARRMRRIARLALIQNLAILLGVGLFFTNTEAGLGAGSIAILVGVVLGLFVLILALRAVMSREQPLPSSRSFLKRSMGNIVAGAQSILGPVEKITRPD